MQFFHHSIRSLPIPLMTIANRNRLLVAATLLWLLASLLASEGMLEDLFSAQADDPFTEEPTTEKTVEKEIRDRPAEPSSPAESYGQTIRTSAWRSPAEELAGFHVPPGFQVELVASEPEIAKPMNLAFDARGRLWLTQSTLYPFPAKQEPAKQESGGNDQASPNSTTSGDAIVILEDRDRDGRYEKKTTFADGLNIPIGLLPYADGAIVFSIPNLYFLRDTDGDGICDERKVLLGPFDTTRDTHGMVNALQIGRAYV